MKVMRSTKEGSSCADCGKEIKLGDPIAYFGPKAVYGLTCHENEKTKKHLANLLAEEKTAKIAQQTGGEVLATEPARQQEWVLRVYKDKLHVDEPLHHERLLSLMLMVELGLAEASATYWDVLCPRSIALTMSKTWAEQRAKGLEGLAEAAPRW